MKVEIRRVAPLVPKRDKRTGGERNDGFSNKMMAVEGNQLGRHHDISRGQGGSLAEYLRCHAAHSVLKYLLFTIPFYSAFIADLIFKIISLHQFNANVRLWFKSVCVFCKEKPFRLISSFFLSAWKKGNRWKRYKSSRLLISWYSIEMTCSITVWSKSSLCFHIKIPRGIIVWETKNIIAL